MLKSLYSGVSGLQSHQIAMDVESNNIANVNTVGFKYSRANFSDLLSQTQSIATAPQGQLGGKNAVQVGLGSTVSSMTRIFSQGSVQNSDKNTDVAIQGDGFFIISPDGGNTYKYTRSGDLKFDASGNFVDNNGFIAQGWVRDEDTGIVDSTAPITNINIAPGLTTPASPTGDVVVKANLNSGPLVESFSPAYPVASGSTGTSPAVDDNGNPIASGDLGVMFNEVGQAFSLQADQGVWASFVSSEITAPVSVSESVAVVTEVTAAPIGTDTQFNIIIDGVAVSAGIAATTVAYSANEMGAQYVNAIISEFEALGRDDVVASYVDGNLTIVSTGSEPIEISQTDPGVTDIDTQIASLPTNLATNPVLGGNQLDVTFTLDDGSTKRITTSGGTGTESVIENSNRYAAAINAQTAITGVAATVNENNELELVNTNSNPSASHNITLAVGVDDNSGLVSETSKTAYKYLYDRSGSSVTNAGYDKTFTTLADLRLALENEARNVGPKNDGFNTSQALAADGTGDDVLQIEIDGVTIDVASEATDHRGTIANAITVTANDGTGDILEITVGGIQIELLASGVDNSGSADDTATEYADRITASGLLPTGITVVANADELEFYNATGDDVEIVVTDNGVTDMANDTIAAGDPAATAAYYALEIQNDLDAAGKTDIVVTSNADGELTITNSTGGDIDIDTGAPFTGPGLSGIVTGTITAVDPTPKDINVEVSVNEQGKFEIINPGGGVDFYDMNLKITGYSAEGVTENEYFTTNMTALNATIPTGSAGKAFSQSFNAATHSSSIDMFDSLGSKHTLRMEFRKTALDTATGSTWDMLITVPQPATIDTLAPLNEKVGQVRFNNDGSLATFSPPNISFSGNNGSSPDQQVNLRFGTANAFDGMTSFDSPSSTSGISQDGYTGGDLVGIRIDQSGTLVGSFSNGRSFGLAQIAMAKFTNNEGLATEGGNVFVQTANSGDPIIGTAATAGRGFIQSSALEASNVDLSRALTQLIIIQRGYQANGKTITTSDQLLQTLIGLKN